MIVRDLLACELLFEPCNSSLSCSLDPGIASFSYVQTASLQGFSLLFPSPTVLW